MKTYELICMSFDGEYVTDSKHETKEDAEETSADMGSKWFFYPWHLIVSGQTVKSAGGCLWNTKIDKPFMEILFENKRLQTVVKAFKKAHKLCLKNDIEADGEQFEEILINQNLH